MKPRQFSAAVAALAIAGAAQAAPPAEAFFGMPTISKATISPNGHYVAYLYTNEKRRQIIAVRDTRKLTEVTVAAESQGEDAPITAVHWINNERLGFTVKDMRVEFEGNLDEFAANRDGTLLTHLISGNWHHRQQSVGSHMKSRVLMADYSFYDRTHDGSDDIIVEKHLWNNTDRQPESSRLYRLNTRTRELADLLPGTQPARVGRWLLDADDTPRIATSTDKGRCIVSYRAKDGKDWSQLSNGDCFTDARIVPRFFDNKNTLYVTAGHQGFTALYTFDIAKGQRSADPLVVLDGFDFSGRPIMDYKTKKLLGMHIATDAQSTVWFDPAMKALQERIDKLVPGMGNLIECEYDCANAQALLVRSSSDRDPVQYLIYHPAANTVVSLGSQHPDIKRAEMGTRDFQRFAARDGLRIPVYITMPPGKPKGPLPTVVLVHGGPWVRGGSWEWDSEAQFLASRGYVVLEPEFRGSTGFGFKHFQAGWRQWGRSMQDDLADTAQWAIRQGWSDPKRIAIMGGSYGGYATLMGLIRHPELFRCGIDYFGVSDINLMFTSARGDFSEYSLRYDLRTLIGDPDKDADVLKQNSPVALADKLKNPLMIAHGYEDRRVPVEHAQRLRSALATPPEWVVYPNEGHGLYHENNRIDFYKRVERFLAKHLQ
ncbi:alpha/beta hydrolase family protein [Pseudoduganella chitinolytica]|uniref:Prolyl oligopeptidase family serine peptidase n=1 Tax=Pseudoduganella chitinolytica TaxID=34070 RepID=A0ABY8BB35_9BURK|nr:prolyl oligopeptidase family serine peptidase [Pseudoduganella chitinolytica]WEF32906.1 prolyl oligopeptidase family serine peptidase [Pseudoduganella chitinolytica]